eukprot:COSAG06_NODE_39273_length_414_cov_1.158730_1_plen_114_part_01
MPFFDTLDDAGQCFQYKLGGGFVVIAQDLVDVRKQRFTCRHVNQVDTTFDTVAAEIDAYGDSATTFSVNASKATASGNPFRDRAAALQEKCKLICGVKDCDYEVRNFIARRTTE